MNADSFTKINLIKPHYKFNYKNNESSNKYEEGISLRDIFIEMSVGIQTGRDEITLQLTKEEISKVVKDFICSLNFITSSGSLGAGYTAPLYLYQDSLLEQGKVSNFKPEFLSYIQKKIGNISPEVILSYIYAILPLIVRLIWSFSRLIFLIFPLMLL